MDRDTDNSWAICLKYHCPLLQQKGTTLRTVLDWASQSQETKHTTYQLWVSYIATTIWTWEQKDVKRLTDFHSGLSVLEQKVNTKTQFIRKGQRIVYGATWHSIIRCKKRETEFPNVWVGHFNGYWWFASSSACKAVTRSDLGALAEEEGWEMLLNNR